MVKECSDPNCGVSRLSISTRGGCTSPDLGTTCSWAHSGDGVIIGGLRDLPMVKECSGSGLWSGQIKDRPIPRVNPG